MIPNIISPTTPKTTERTIINVYDALVSSVHSLQQIESLLTPVCPQSGSTVILEEQFYRPSVTGHNKVELHLAIVETSYLKSSNSHSDNLFVMHAYVLVISCSKIF